MNKYLTKRKVICCLSIFVIYFLMTFPFKSIVFANGYSELRLTGLLPMAVGMLFGFSGALSCALGNLAGDLYAGFNVYCIFGFFGNFLMAWIPYKLWHTIFFYKDHRPCYLNSMFSIFKFVAISFIASCISVGVISAGGQLLHGFKFSGFFLMVGLQYYDLSLLGGMLILQIGLKIFHIQPYVHENVYRQVYIGKRYILDYCFVAADVVLCCILAYITGFGKDVSEGGVSALCVLVLVITGVLAFIPMVRGPVTKQKQSIEGNVGIQSQFVTIFIVLLFLFMLIIGLGSYRILMTDFRHFAVSEELVGVVWMRILLGGAGIGTVLIFILGLLLQLIQKKVVDPVHAVTEYTRKFVSGEKLADKKLYIADVGNEIDVLGESVNHMVEDIRDFVEEIRKRTVKEEKLAAELSIARDIQQGMLPAKWSGTGFDLEPYIKPAKEVGGDFYHFVKLSEDCVFVCIADVSGKDISAAMFMVQAKILIEAACTSPPNEMLAKVNNILSKANKAMLFVTAFAAIIDRKEKRMSYANAGHNPPVYFNHNKTSWLDNEQPDFVLGAVGDVEYQLYHMAIEEDFKLFIYTDGVNEAENKEGEFLGNERLFQWIDQLMKEQADCKAIIRQMESHLELFTEGANQSDDITMLTLAIK